MVVDCTSSRGAVQSTDILGPILHLLGPDVPPICSGLSRICAANASENLRLNTQGCTKRLGER